MAVNLGGWGWAVNMALDFGAPALGMAFGIPGPVSSFAVNALKKALGLKQSATEEEVKTAAETNPEVAKAAFQSAESEVTAKYAYLTRLAEVQADVSKANVTEVNQSIRDETAKGVSWWHWRHLIGYLVILYGLQQIGMLWIAAIYPKVLSPADAANLFNATTIFTGGLFALLGYIAQDTSAKQVAAMTGQPVPGILSTAIKGITGGKK